MMNEQGFDLWADGYDRSVGLSDEDGTYPFAGYKAVLNRIYQGILQTPRAQVLDIGFGTATLTARLYAQGCEITGVDFSSRMIELAREKMPEARLYQADFSRGLPEAVMNRTYDAIVATYSLHHLTDAQKVEFIGSLLSLLKDGGRIWIGDVAFETRAALEECARASGDAWDGDEHYFVYDQIRACLGGNVTFEKASYCAGVLTMGK